VSFFRRHLYQEALVEFQRAYQLSPNYRVLYNIARTAGLLKNHALALESFQRYLEEGGKAFQNNVLPQ
jgi:tetratricopeptide (TPR) repeat protein